VAGRPALGAVQCDYVSTLTECEALRLSEAVGASGGRDGRPRRPRGEAKEERGQKNWAPALPALFGLHRFLRGRCSDWRL